MRFSTFAIPLLVSTACSTQAEEATCAQAEERIGECYGQEAATAYVCDPQRVEDIVSLSCSELAEMESRSDFSFCSVFGIFCPADAIFPDPSGQSTVYPIVLAHGFNGSPENEWGVHSRVVSELQRDGHQIYIARVSPFRSVEVRGAELAAEIDLALAEFGADKVNIIAHSMGGLDSRFAITSLDMTDKVASLVTISTPHRGSYVADAALGLIPQFADVVVDAIATAFARSFTSDELANDSSMRDAFSSLAESNAATFNSETPDSDKVYYQSWAGVSNVARIGNSADQIVCTEEGGKMYTSPDASRDFMDLRLVPMAAIVAHGTDKIPNDGMATVASARWGDFKGCIPADHYDEIGQVDDDAFDRATGFDAGAFYRTIAYDLATRGF